MTLAESAASYLRIYLDPFAAFLERPDVTDIYVNAPGELWVEALGGLIVRHDAPQVTEAHLWRLARQIAAVSNQGISREHPLLAATLPTGARVQIIAPPATRGPLAMAIRKHVVADLSLDRFAAAGAFACASADAEAGDPGSEMEESYRNQDWTAFLSAAVKSRKTIVVSGGTSTGKTTFVNALINEIGSDERLVLIEDTPELRCRHANSVGLVAARGNGGEARVDTEDLLIASLRLRPDRIILGEVRGPEAFTFLRAVNTGHPGSLTTIHAERAEGVVEQMALLVLASGSRLSRDEIARNISNAVDVFVHLERVDGRRLVTEIRWPKQERPH
ncbi:P-type DNA transfer ATPase VirB11 [Sphingomonas sp. GCM10030256]|uniref:P-type DNA transfer ATPase VirB11 n=1 Tax=Sphingomonas sp. GCM10030256 TaxID=3273427 RepID=UPI00360B53CF